MFRSENGPPSGPPVRAGRRRPRGPVRRSAAALLAVLALLATAACSAGGGLFGDDTSAAGCSPHARTQLTFWGWPAGYDQAVAAFNRSHPATCVHLENAGASTAEYTKLNNALKAGSGAPDLATVEYFALPSFEVGDDLVDLTRYGVRSTAADTAPAALAQVVRGGRQYAVPVDLGPMALFYNAALFSAHHLRVPRTWTEFATEAAALHRADPKAAITNLDPLNAQAVLALMEQYGAFPFGYDGGSRLAVDFTGPRQRAFAAYWQRLIDSGAVTTAAEFSPVQWANLDSGANAVRLSPAWGPVGMQLSIKKTLGHWRTAPLPTATGTGTATGQAASANWGGSSIAVVKGSKHPREAAEFARWFGTNAASWKILDGPVGGAFPGHLAELKSPAFLDRTLPISGPSRPNRVFAQAARTPSAAQWPPIMTAVLTQWASTLAGVAKGTDTLEHAFRTLQGELVDYARSQGFTVITDRTTT